MAFENLGFATGDWFFDGVVQMVTKKIEL